jgi:hypothetical protein
MRKGTVPFLLEVAAAGATGVAMYVAVTGPLRIDLPAGALSVRTPARPILAALILITVRALWDRRSSRADGTTLAAVVSHRAARTALAGMVVAGVAGWFTFLSTTCGGADSYGYVSAADRLLAGQLVDVEPLAAILPFERGIDAATPLGFVASGRTAAASVPAYPLGLPALMAVGRLAAGPLGPFLVPPLMGLVLLVAVCAIARDWYGDADITRLTCALVAVNPLVFTYAIQPMSDVPAAACAAVAMAGLSRPRRWPVLSGVAAALSLLIRPALAPMAVAIAIVPLAMSGWRGWKDTARCLAPITVAVVVQAWTQWYFYGDALASGYGSVASLFSVERAWFNARSYGYWSLRAIGPVAIGAFAIGLGVSGRLPRVAVLLVALSVGGPYLFYRPYDHWETLRFLLPIIVVGAIVAAAGLMTVARAVAGASFGAAPAALVAVLTASMWVAWISTNHVLTMPASEARHRVAADLVAETTPETAVVLALQHTGSLRYYARRQTVNWDRIPQGAFDATVAALEAAGHPVFLMLDSIDERTMFEARHGAVLDRGTWLPNGQRGNVQLFQSSPP